MQDVLFFAEMKSSADHSLTASDYMRLALAKAYAGGITDNHRAYERERKGRLKEQEIMAEKKEEPATVTDTLMPAREAVQPPPKVKDPREMARSSRANQTPVPATSSSQPSAKRKAVVIEPKNIPPKRGRR